MGVEYPASTFVGLDITDVFKATEMPPPNCSFVQADARQGLPFADNTFDYVFSRAASLAYQTNVWPFIINEFVRVLKPGGTVEIFELVMPLHDGGPATTRFYHEWIRTSLKLRDVDVEAMIPRFEPLLKSSGIENVTHEIGSWPLGWGPSEEYAQLSRENVISFMNASKPKLTVVLGVGDDSYDANTAVAEKELQTYKSYVEAHVFHGKKA
ncbi:hypothetical protein BC937DRAFT_93955 [Endogone sp. FLAS-F59071]|nr:hypothetical protein BC937DRAFT_93955 [Endogone sp. FLAS-F59071]|eukprot:RUS20965.1 hypothetical protein BC937DRAFT_93955 [Endogone sp. FLAS-F59071]